MFALLLAPLILVADPAPVKAVAMIVSLSGNPTRGDGKTSRPLKCFDRLHPGETIRAGSGCSVTVYFPDDGHKEVLHPDSSLVIEEKKGKATGKVDVIESKLKVENRTALREAIGAGKIGGRVSRGGAPLSLPTIPGNETRIVTDKPTFHWPALKEAASYRVTLKTAGTGQTLWSYETTDTEIKFPSDAKPLVRVAKYQWSVTAIFANKDERIHLKERTFTVGTEKMAKHAEMWKALAESADPADQVLAAVGYEHLGMLDELYPLYAKITKTVTNDANLWAILAVWAARAGLEKEADAARGKAKQLGWTEEP